LELIDTAQPVRRKERMKLHKLQSVFAVGVACFLIVFGTVAAADGLLEVANSQRELWMKMGAALLSFSGGYLLVEGGVRRVAQRFNEAVARHEQELGHSLQTEEREAIKKVIRSSASDSRGILRFNHPLVRIVTRILLVTMPTVILVGVLVAGGAFIAGLGLALLVAELTKRLLHHL
jgi:hypothetical protein